MTGALSLTVFVLICLVVAAAGAAFQPGPWYLALAKPAWTPPGWLFAPVWSLLYLSIAVAGWLIWRRAGLSEASGAFTLYALQLLLNGIWSWLFFGLHRPDLALLDIAVLWLAVLGTIIAFMAQVSIAGWLLLPYLAWLTLAGALNFAIWRLNS